MKTRDTNPNRPLSNLLTRFLIAAFMMTFSTALWADTPKAQPEILAIWVEDKIVHVEVDVPVGLKTITLESRTKLGYGTWVPRRVERLDGQGGVITLTLPYSNTLEMLRVKAESSDPLPSSFYQGEKQFDGAAYSGGPNDFTDFAAPEAGGPLRGGDDQAGDPLRDVSESDIWAVQGDTLYFFNQFRGLQVIDLTTPSSPVILGSYPLPAAGEEMYLMGSDHVILLARSGCQGGNDAASEVLLINVQDPVHPTVISRLPVPGTIAESRMVGSALYVASNTYYYRTDENDRSIWEYGTVVSSFDLSNPIQPVTQEPIRFAGNSNVIQATSEYLMVAVRPSYWLDPASVHLIDISDPQGVMTRQGTIRAAGYVADKFKMNIHGDILTLISETRSRENSERLTLLENFSLETPERPQKMGDVEVGHGESLFATRITKDRAYIVTFLQIDPLWIVDLSDPANPTVTGELEIPGWSTFIYPMDGRLVTVGIDNVDGWKVAVQLFDVSDPTHPTLLSKVPLGEDYSWSEANSNEKALTVLPESGLILVPYYEYANQDSHSKVQLIELNEDTLAARGVIDHTIQPRRADIYQDWILSISGRELLVVDAQDRDNPVLTGNLELAWPVDWVIPYKSHVIQISGTTHGTTHANPMIRVTDDQDLGDTLRSFQLTHPYPITGVESRDGMLYVMQSAFHWGWYPIEPIAEDGTKEGETPEPEATSVLSVIDLNRLPEIAVIGESISFDEDLASGSLTNPIWIGDDLLIWVGNGGNYGHFYRGGMGILDVSGRFAGDIWYPWWGGSQGFTAYDVSDSEQPKLVSHLSLDSERHRWNYSKAFVEGNLVFLSFQTSEFEEGILLPGQNQPRPEIKIDEDGNRVEVVPPFGAWIERHFLKVIDYTDPTSPTQRPDVNIPGVLQGISHQGNLLYTTGFHYNEAFTTDYKEWLDISAYDGISASRVASMALSETWPRPVTVYEGRVFVGITDANQSESRVASYDLTQTGQIERGPELTLAWPAQYLVVRDDLLVISGGNQVGVAEGLLGSELLWLGENKPDGCVWYSFDKMTGDRESGLWFPLGEYGAFKLDIE